jgi:nitrate reductase NapAB chaperone NapD
MPIISYLIYPQAGRKNQLLKNLSLFESCEVIPAENEELIILVTDTKDKIEEEQLLEKIDALENLKMRSMVSGFNSPKNN